ncbi:MAG TPA: HAD-IB family phosphatase [Candidatus Nanoarchaeia archaeon]|nr:HAD-IB family phosphatase [Candidatus Nanoarchaeia archaeon]
MKVSLVIPAYNEEKTIRKVVETAKKVTQLTEIIVVDDGSTDNTYKEIKNLGIHIYRHKTNMGKGAAISTGISKAKGDVIVFLDADIQNVSPRKITALFRPIMNGEADFVKAAFMRSRGRVTELVVRPLFKIFAPSVNFSQPLSGQFAAKKEFLKEIAINTNWGVDIQLVFEGIKRGLRFKEVDIGKIVHKKQPLARLSVMSEEVMKTIFENLGIIRNTYKLVAFDLDGTLIDGSSIEFFAKEWGFEKELKKLREEYYAKKIKDSDITYKLAKFFKGKNISDVEEVCSKIKLRKYADKVVQKLVKKKYIVAIISLAYSPVVSYFSRKLGISYNVCPQLKTKNNKFTGNVVFRLDESDTCCDKAICKNEAIKQLAEMLSVKLEECVAVGDSKSDSCMFDVAGMSMSIGKNKLNADIKIKNLSEVLVNVD